jgi:hypothetical protein
MVPAVLPADAAAPPPDMENVYGLWVYGGSAGTVRTIAAVLAGLLATALAAAGWGIYQARHRLPLARITALRTLRLR